MKRVLLFLVLALLVPEAPFAILNPGVVFEVETSDHSGTGRPLGETGKMMVEGSKVSFVRQFLPPGPEWDWVDELIYFGDGGRDEGGRLFFVDRTNGVYVEVDGQGVVDGQDGPTPDNEKTAPGENPTAGQPPVTVTEDVTATVGDDVGKELLPNETDPLTPSEFFASMSRSGVEPPLPGDWLYKKVGNPTNMNGYPVEEYDLLRGGKILRKVWIADWDSFEVGVANEANTAIYKLGEFFERVMPGVTNPVEPMPNRGFAARIQDIGDDGAVLSETNLTNVRRGRLDPAEFELGDLIRQAMRVR